ncbi:MAG: nucleotidyl transferase AbiEii/AbiGii toxin family protein [Patescibacteria group bacterium]|nr:nucleotidyl transferase AbiEii/AbiGii toxin family protein [Patescibacteria group bacterium]
MIDRQEIDAKASEFNIQPSDVQKDYVYGWMLKGIFENHALGQRLSLKGGAALRKAYFAESRFSKDLDFSVAEEVDEAFLHDALNEVCGFVTENTGVKFRLDRTLVEDKGVPIAGRQVLEARAYFDSFYGEKEMILKTQLDVTQFDKHYLPLQRPALLHPYSDKDTCATTLVCQKAEEIFASKLVALLHRRRAKDLFDLFCGLIINRVPPVNRTEVITTFLKRSIYEPIPSQGKQHLLDIPIEESRSFWGGLVVPAAALYSFDHVATNFHQLIEELFALVPAPALAAPAPRGFTHSGIRRPTHSSIYPRATSHSPSPSYDFGGLSSSDRNTIIDAGRSQTLIELGYKGYRRLVEPYKFEYRIRQSDNRGIEYFWGYDRSGGESGKTSIKQFFVDEIEYVRPTTSQFIPQWTVEL